MSEGNRMMLQRDSFIGEVCRALETDQNIYFLSADFGAAALDDLRARFKDNFIHCGISEQGMLDVAVGLALEGKKVFCYAMAPFLSMRALEQVKCGPGIMNLPICLISVGVGIGYADSGPTHYATEEFACLRSIIGSTILTAADTPTARRLAKSQIANPRFSYVRLDRHALPTIDIDSDYDSFRIIGEKSKQKIALISHGKMLHACIEASKSDPNKFFAIDLIQSKPFPTDLVEILDGIKGVIVVDEQSPCGALGSAVYEACSAKNIFPRVINLTLPEEYLFDNIGRDRLLEKHGLSAASIVDHSKRLQA
jgi:transketolase